MNIQQFIENPQLIDTLTPNQKVDIFQKLQQHEQHLQQEKIKLETQLTLKQQEQQDLFKQLQDLTHKQTLPEIQEYINQLQQDFDTQLKTILQQYQDLQEVNN